MNKIYSLFTFVASMLLVFGCTATDKAVLRVSHSPDRQPIKLTQIASYLHDEQRTLTNINFIDDQQILIEYRNGAMLLNIPSNKIIAKFTHSEFPNTKAVGFEIRQNGQYLFLGYSDRVDLWNIAERKIIEQMADLDPVYAASISHDLKYIFAAGALWSTDKKSKIQKFTQITKVLDASFSPDDRILLIVDFFFGVSINDVQSNKQLYYWKIPRGIFAYQFSPDSKRAYMIQNGPFDNSSGHTINKKVRVYSIESGKLLATYAHDSPIVAWSPITRSSDLYTSTEDNKIIEWSNATHKKTRVWETQQKATVLKLDDKNRLWCGFENGDIKVLTENSDTLETVANLQGSVYALNLNTTNDLLAVNLRKGTQHQIITYRIEDNE